MPGSGEYGGLERHALYESAVQSPQGDISYLLRFYKQYVGVQVQIFLQALGTKLTCACFVLLIAVRRNLKQALCLQVPEHLREDFCGTALISATWCRGDVRRTAIGLDIDREALEWGLDHNGGSLTDEPRPRLCLFKGDVCDPLAAALPVRLPAASADDTAESMAQMTLRAEAQAVDADTSGKSGETGPPCGNRSGSVAQEEGKDAVMMASSIRQHKSNQLEDEDEEADSDTGSCPAKPVDITCALNFSVCLLHLRSDVVVRFFPLLTTCSAPVHVALHACCSACSKREQCEKALQVPRSCSYTNIAPAQTFPLLLHLALLKQGPIPKKRGSPTDVPRLRAEVLQACAAGIEHPRWHPCDGPAGRPCSGVHGESPPPQRGDRRALCVGAGGLQPRDAPHPLLHPPQRPRHAQGDRANIIKHV